MHIKLVEKYSRIAYDDTATYDDIEDHNENNNAVF